jgi:hypothetical protein
MTRDEVSNMPAGREMDALVAEYVMGVKVARHVWTPTSKDDFGVIGTEYTHAVLLPENNWKESTVITTYDPIEWYSTDIVSSLSALDKFGVWRSKKDLKGYWVAVWDTSNPNWQNSAADGESFGCETLPLAICRAMLLAATQKGNKK